MRKSVIAAATVLVLLVAGCSSSGGDSSKGASGKSGSAGTSDSADTVAVETWAADFCGAFKGWLTDIHAASDSVGEDVSPGDVKAGKQAIIGLFETASKQTQALIDDIDGAGTPDIKNGAGLVTDLKGKFQDFDDAIQSAKTEADDLATDDAGAFKTQVDALRKTFQDETQKVGDSFAELDAKYDSQPLDDALTASCKLT
jgi:hypothetical protein